MNTRRTILAPRGFPWRSLLAGLAAIALCLAVVMGVAGIHSVGGAFVISAIIGIAAFAGTLG